MRPKIIAALKNLLVVGILLTTVLILWLIFRPAAPWVAPAPSGYELPKDLYKWYQIYNTEFFDDKLPRNVVIDWDEHDPSRMAATSKLPDGRFHITFNQRYCLADRVAHMALLHEDCHIVTWAERVPDVHGPAWRTCMLNLYQTGAFKAELIDGSR
jgi:SprT-like family